MTLHNLRVVLTHPAALPVAASAAATMFLLAFSAYAGIVVGLGLTWSVIHVLIGDLIPPRPAPSPARGWARRWWSARRRPAAAPRAAGRHHHHGAVQMPTRPRPAPAYHPGVAPVPLDGLERTQVLPRTEIPA